MKRIVILAAALILSACRPNPQPATYPEPCCPPLAVVAVPPRTPYHPTAIERLRAAAPGALLSLRRIDQYQLVQVGDVGALLSGDTIVSVWRIR